MQYQCTWHYRCAVETMSTPKETVLTIVLSVVLTQLHQCLQESPIFCSYYMPCTNDGNEGFLLYPHPHTPTQGLIISQLGRTSFSFNCFGVRQSVHSAIEWEDYARCVDNFSQTEIEMFSQFNGHCSAVHQEEKTRSRTG